MNIPGSIQAELDAAREEGRQAGLREAIAHCEAKYNECLQGGMVARANGQTELREAMSMHSIVYMAIAGELKAKVDNG